MRTSPLVILVALAAVAGHAGTASAASPSSTPTTTSTTLAPPDCRDDVEPGTVNVVRCRLGLLADQVDAASGLGVFQPKLHKTLAQVRRRVDEAASECDAGDDETAGRRMKQAGKFLQKMTHRLSGLSARKRLDGTLRAELIQVIDSVRTDVGTLRKQPCGGS